MTNLQDAEQKFLNHDWVNDKEWKLYLSNLYPSPSMQNIEKYKKKYFQKNIDKNLNINTNFETDTKEEKKETPVYTQPNNNVYNSKNITHLMTLLYSTFLLTMSIFYFILLALNISFYKKMATLVSMSYLLTIICTLFFDYKIHKKYTTFVQIFSSPLIHYLSYSMILFFIKDSILIFLPVFLTILINAYYTYKEIRLLLPQAIQKNYYLNTLVFYLDRTIFNIYEMRANVEIYNLLFIIICLFLRRATILNLIVYMHFFKLKYTSTDTYFHSCYSKNGKMIRQFLSHPMAPKMLLNIFDKISHYFHVYLNGGRR
ncbi:TMEM33 domain-containing protein, putative [Hepatocystis sp. ex Piliocolobus tephrosceles]|nr:TMEM33 domain-containing protein, putative [Hepatocystis sp. ex Piliocolobus tephrosceles]